MQPFYAPWEGATVAVLPGSREGEGAEESKQEDESVEDEEVGGEWDVV